MSKKSGCCGGSGEKSKAKSEIRINTTEDTSGTTTAKSKRRVDLSKGVKLCFLGEAGVGKSSIVSRYVKNTFDEHQPPTVGAAFLSKTHELNDKSVRFDLWDTAGQERFQSLAPLYYRGSLAAIITYDITDYKSYERAKHWLKELQQGCSGILVILFAGNKLDLAEKRQVEAKEVELYANHHHCVYMECSAKTGDNISELFDKVANTLYERAEIDDL